MRWQPGADIPQKNGEKFKQFDFEHLPIDPSLPAPETRGCIATIRTGLRSDFSHWLVSSRRAGGGCPSHLSFRDGRIVANGGAAIATPEERDVAARAFWVGAGRARCGAVAPVNRPPSSWRSTPAQPRSGGACTRPSRTHTARCYCRHARSPALHQAQQAPIGCRSASCYRRDRNRKSGCRFAKALIPQARGVVHYRSCQAARALPVVEVAPTVAKRILTGRGDAVRGGDASCRRNVPDYRRARGRCAGDRAGCMHTCTGGMNHYPKLAKRRASAPMAGFTVDERDLHPSLFPAAHRGRAGARSGPRRTVRGHWPWEEPANA